MWHWKKMCSLFFFFLGIWRGRGPYRYLLKLKSKRVTKCMTSSQAAKERVKRDEKKKKRRMERSLQSRRQRKIGKKLNQQQQVN